jgi:hypothetical protein
MKTRRMIAGAALIGLMAVCGIAGYTIATWDKILPQVQGSIVAGVFTMLSAIGGVGVVMYQLRRQAENTKEANARNEAMKLKKQIYEEILEVCSNELKTEAALRSYIQRYSLDVNTATILAKTAVAITIPEARYKRLIDLVSEHSTAVNAVVSMTEKWEIVDPRVDVFRPALHVKKQELLMAQMLYNGMALMTMPFDNPQGPPFWMVHAQKPDELKAKGDAVCAALWNLGTCVGDYQTEMQNALLGELFKGNKAPVRQPLDAAYRPIELAKRDELMAFFDQHEHWGKAKDLATQKLLQKKGDRTK